MKLGIGVTTFNRAAKLESCLARVKQFTAAACQLVVADDGATDRTEAVCAQAAVIRVAGQNMGIAWNKNRALFFLHRILECDVIILIEDDCYPNQADWETDWIRAATKWGHANFGAPWFRDKFLGGTGTVDNPFVCPSLSGQCAAFSDRARSACGYLDSRFKSYGYEHAEHSSRLVRAGFGGEMRMTDRGELEPHYFLLAADLTVSSDESYRDEASLAANWDTWTRMYGEPIYRQPWRTREEFRQFRDEMRSATRRAKFSTARRLRLEARWRQWRRPPESPARAPIL